MPLKVEHERPEIVRMWPTTIEQCVFCQTETRWWHRPTNDPVCPTCADSRSAAEIPQKTARAVAFDGRRFQVSR